MCLCISTKCQRRLFLRLQCRQRTWRWANKFFMCISLQLCLRGVNCWCANAGWITITRSGNYVYNHGPLKTTIQYWCNDIHFERYCLNSIVLSDSCLLSTPFLGKGMEYKRCGSLTRCWWTRHYRVQPSWQQGQDVVAFAIACGKCSLATDLGKSPVSRDMENNPFSVKPIWR